ncbi:HAD family hydrolase [Mucilaginibacter sp.]
MYKALIADLDNTIYPVTSIGDRLFAPLVQLMEDHKDEIGEDDIQEIKKKIMKKPFQQVADQHDLPEKLKQQGTELLNKLTVDFEMQHYDDYQVMQQLKTKKFLVTMGFMEMQKSKVARLDLDKDFDEVFIVDPETTEEKKIDIFKQILESYQLKPEEVLVIGDDAESEIKAGRDLGMDTYLRNADGSCPAGTATYQNATLRELAGLFQ